MIRFSNATNRNTKCYWVQVNDLTVLVSYETIVAASYNGQHVRLDNRWGPTTGRHLKETNTVNNRIVSECELYEFVSSALTRNALDRLSARLVGKPVPIPESALA